MGLRPSMLTLDPFRFYRRRRRLMREAQEEAQYLRRRHGPMALSEARAKAKSPELTRWGRRVLDETVKLLEKQAH